MTGSETETPICQCEDCDDEGRWRWWKSTSGSSPLGGTEMSDRRAEDDSGTSREIKLDPALSEIAAKAGVTSESAAIVDAEVRNGELYVTVAGEKNLQETTHRLPEELQ